MRIRGQLLVCVSALLFCAPAYSFQVNGTTSAAPGKAHVVPGARYEAGWLHRFFLGSHWRDLWTTEIEVEILDLDHFAGGLTPTVRGGGRETKSLRFRGADGKEYKFRSLDKDPTLALTPELRKSIAADFAQDQISSANPFAALVVTPILNAVGVLNAGVRPVVLPDDSRLGEFQEEFGGKLGTIEENPAVDRSGERSFAGADKIIGTYSLYKRLEEDNDEQVDAKEFLKARLMDIYLGDWDRHADQWRWAGIKDGKKWSWRPIPRDRDQAFSRFDGIIPSIGDMLITEVESFEDHYKDIEDLTWTGRYLDRHFLSSLDKRAFDSISTLITEKLTDPVIAEAVHQLPPEIYAKAGEWLERALKLRRDNLRKASDEYYNFLSRFPDIRGSDKPEYAEIHRLDDHRVEVALYKRGKSSGEKKGDPFYDRVFDDEHTKEIRLYLLGGDDLAVVDGEVEKSITVRIIGGSGRNSFVDSSRVNGRFLGLVPRVSTETYIYDNTGKSDQTLGPGTSYDHDPETPPDNDTMRFEPPQRDYGHIWRFNPWYGASPEDGLFLGGGPVLYDYGFRAVPYVSRMELRGGYATGAKKFRFDFQSESFTLVPGARVQVTALASQLERLNFFGFGNETPFDENLNGDRYYEVQQAQVIVRPSIGFSILPELTLTLGGMLKYVKTDLKDGTLLDSLRPAGFDQKIVETDVSASLSLDMRDNASLPRHGGLLEIEGSYFPRTLDNQNSFGKLHGEARSYLSAEALTGVTLAARIGAEKIWGDHPFFETPSIGGKTLLRGFDKERFEGDATVYGGAELRVSLGKFLILLPGTFGVTLLAETGRVYLSGESSNRWHNAAGGGFWFSVIKPEYLVSASIARSSEKTGIYVSGGFSF
jgi:surface antigen Omp85-like protein